MKLVFYSGGGERENRRLDRMLFAMTSNKRPGMTFIPSGSDFGPRAFEEFINHYDPYSVSKFIYFPVDIPFSAELCRHALSQDIVHLSGGNTFYFLKSLRRAKLLPELWKFARKGGILTGLSAGAILMTPSIETAGFPSFDRDDNDVGLKNFKSLGLVDFEFFPHFAYSHRYKRELLKYSRRVDVPLYACPDGAGLIVDGPEVRVVGDAMVFLQGASFRVRGRV